MPIRTRHNLYPGVNAHLNSYLQTESWESFHAEHIIDIRRVIAASLPDGYYARAEKSLQISEYEADMRLRSTRIKPDVAVYRTQTSELGALGGSSAATPAYTVPLLAPFDLQKRPTGVTIYRAEPDKLPGTPVTHLELLSPANKPGSAYFERYAEKRYETVRSGLNLVEVDYLHQTAPVAPKLPTYPQDQNSFPYMILLSRPEPLQTAVYGVGVLDPLPTVHVPLSGADAVVVDFGTTYNRTYDSLDIPMLVVDYDTAPAAFEKFSEADQQLIQAYLQPIRAGN